MNVTLELVADYIANSRKIAVLTGAGTSAESGVPTFRAQGQNKSAQAPLWEKYDPSELASPSGFKRHPDLVWQWYDWRRNLVESVSPNAGHHALAALEKLYHPQPRTFTLITQNVDRLHHRAKSQNILEMHGNIVSFRCFDHGHQAGEVERSLPSPPLCNDGQCHSKLRPNVVWFGESLDSAVLDAAMAAARQCDVFIAIGTSALVQPAASLPYIAREHGAKLVEINLERTALSENVDAFLQGRSGDVLPSLVDLVKAHPRPV